jgi:SAM-dependent methyltransferase
MASLLNVAEDQARQHDVLVRNKMGQQQQQHKQQGASKAGLTFSKLGDWSTMAAERWHDAMYYEGGYFMDLKEETLKYCKRQCEARCGPVKNCNFIEVGSGTGDILLGVAGDFQHSLGVDINADFVEYSRRNTPNNVRHKVTFVEGSATDLDSLVQSELPSVRQSPAVVACVNNTLGVFPDAIKPATYAQMKKVAGDGGLIVIGFWNGNKFGDALQHFYHEHPELCGSMEGASIDWINHTLITKDGYLTHWTTPGEAEETLRRYGFEVVDVWEIGVGVLCTCKGKSSDKLSLSTAPAAASSSKAALAPASPTSSVNIYDMRISYELYWSLWGGHNQHVGLHESSDLLALPPLERIQTAAERASMKLFQVAPPGKGKLCMDFGSGFGTTARLAASRFGARVSCVDLNPHANELNRRLVDEAGLEGLVSVPSERNFLSTGEPSNSVDMIFSQDAMCHVTNLDKAFEEAARVLVNGGTFAFTDIFVDSQVPKLESERLFTQLSIKTLRTPDYIINTANNAGLELVDFQDDSPSLVKHFSALKEALAENRDTLVHRRMGPEELNEIEKEFDEWLTAGRNGVLCWGYFVFRKDD